MRVALGTREISDPWKEFILATQQTPSSSFISALPATYHVLSVVSYYGLTATAGRKCEICLASMKTECFDEHSGGLKFGSSK